MVTKRKVSTKLEKKVKIKFQDNDTMKIENKEIEDRFITILSYFQKIAKITKNDLEELLDSQVNVDIYFNITKSQED